MSNFYNMTTKERDENDFTLQAIEMIDRGYPVPTENVKELADILKSKHEERLKELQSD